MSQHKTLVILSPGFASSEEDTSCLPMQQHLVKAFNEVAPEVNIIILSFQYPYHHGVYNWFGNVVFSFNGRNRGGLQRLFLRRKIHTVLRELNKRSPISGLLSFWYGECAVSGKRFGDQYGIPHYCWISGQDARKENKYPARASLKSTELIAISDFIRDEFEKNHKTRPFRVIVPGIDIGSFKNEERDIDILGAGSLIPLKRFDIFLETVSGLKKQFPGIRVVLAGDGSEKEKLIAMANDFKLETNIEFRGAVKHHEVLQLMKRTKVLLHPSSYEGFSGVCLEALAAGAHVISFTKAMKEDINQWHIAETSEAMLSIAASILEHTNTSFDPSNSFSINDTARKFLDLFFRD